MELPAKLVELHNEDLNDVYSRHIHACMSRYMRVGGKTNTQVGGCVWLGIRSFGSSSEGALIRGSIAGRQSSAQLEMITTHGARSWRMTTQHPPS
jgi:hypothetical protein